MIRPLTNQYRISKVGQLLKSCIGTLSRLYYWNGGREAVRGTSVSHPSAWGLLFLEFLLVEHLDDAGRIAYGHDVVGHVFRHYRCRSHDSPLAHSDTGQDAAARSHPCAPADADGLAGDDVTLVGVVIVRYELYVGGNARVVVDGDAARRHHQCAVHHDHVLADADAVGAHHREWRHHARAFAEFSLEYFPLQLPPLVGVGERLVESVYQLCVAGGEGQLFFRLLGAVNSYFFHDSVSLYGV